MTDVLFDSELDDELVTDIVIQRELEERERTETEIRRFWSSQLI